MEHKKTGKGQVVVVSVGEGAFNQGATHEGLAFAAALNLPVIVICENNGWSELTKAVDGNVQSGARGAARQRLRHSGVTIDGTDPIAVRDTIKHLAERVRNGGGPAVSGVSRAAAVGTL
jgi:2-oxoisovalerate dehydrogenase E1 component